jgi:hypothetical protein
MAHVAEKIIDTGTDTSMAKTKKRENRIQGKEKFSKTRKCFSQSF